jgi:branched-subunit amino acid transport protein
LLGGLTIWFTIIGMGVLTFLLRLSFIALLGRVRLPAVVQRGLNFVPPAVFAALIIPDIFNNQMMPFSLQTHARLVAGAIAVVVAWRTKNVVLTIGTGLLVLLILQSALR